MDNFSSIIEHCIEAEATGIERLPSKRVELYDSLQPRPPEGEDRGAQPRHRRSVSAVKARSEGVVQSASGCV
jgi:hypothetical protein